MHLHQMANEGGGNLTPVMQVVLVGGVMLIHELAKNILTGLALGEDPTLPHLQVAVETTSQLLDGILVWLGVTVETPRLVRIGVQEQLALEEILVDDDLGPVVEDLHQLTNKSAWDLLPRLVQIMGSCRGSVLSIRVIHLHRLLLNELTKDILLHLALGEDPTAVDSLTKTVVVLASELGQLLLVGPRVSRDNPALLTVVDKLHFPSMKKNSISMKR